MQQKQFTLNTFFVIASFAVNFLVGFFMSPYLVSRLGVASYGFISLASNIFAITGLLTVALNSMAARFLTVAVHRNDLEDANIQFNTVFFANLFLACLLGTVLTGVLFFRDHIFNIPAGISSEFGILFGIQIAVNLLSFIFSTFGCVFLVKNRLDWMNMFLILNKVLYVISIVVLFRIFAPSLMLVGFSLLLPTLVVITGKFVYSRKLLPELKIKFSCFRWQRVVVLVNSGVWNSVTSLARTCLFSLDILFANIFLGAWAAGIMAVAKIIPMQMDFFCSAINSIFTPTFTRLYACDNQSALCRQVRTAINFTAFLILVPMLMFIAYGRIFFDLWMHGVKSHEVYILACMATIPLLLSVPCLPLRSIQVAYNKLKMPALVLAASGLLVVVSEIVLLKFTDLGLLALALPIAVINPLCNTAFGLIYTAKITGQSRCCYIKQFMVIMFKTALLFIIISGFRMLYTPDSWLTLILTCAAAGMICWGIGFFLYFSREEQNVVADQIKIMLKKLAGRQPRPAE